MTTLPPFSGDDPPCLKCGWTDARTEYLPFGDCAHGLGDRTTVGFHPNERLHRECTRCGFQWDEAIVEAVHVGGNAEDCPACTGTNPDYPFICPGPALTEPDNVLHAERRHPAWEYATTEGPRKQWTDIDTPPCDDNGDPDPTWERNTDAGRPGEGWDRFDYTEESYWRRLKQQKEK